MSNKLILPHILILMLLALLPSLTLAGEYDSDCYNEMGGSNRSVLNGRYLTSDDNGVKEACRNGYFSTNERYILKREEDPQIGTIYKVTRSYCWARNWFRDNSCQWPTGPAWGDTYTGVFLFGEVRDLDDGEGRVVLKRGGYTLEVKVSDKGDETIEKTGHGLPGAHVCLKRTAKDSIMPHGVKNPYKRNAVCAYLVHLRVSDSCRNPVGDWSSALIGCVEEPLKTPPPTFNVVMPAEIAPFVDPQVTFNDYLTKYGSTFDQPVIKLLNGQVSPGNEAKGEPKVGELVLRYKFKGDTTIKDTLKSSGSFPRSKSKLVYKAWVDDNNPGQVCACEAADCDKRIYIGCVNRPTPRDSNLKVVAEYAQHPTDKSPAVKVHFARTDSTNEILYKDGDGQRVTLDNKGDAFKVDQSGRPTTTPARGPITYDKLPLISNPIREYYIGNIDKPEADRSYTRDVVRVYGVEFQAIIPRMKPDGTPAFVALDTEQTRTDGCRALKIADDQNDEQKPPYFVPAGDRDRTYCKCVKGRPCPVPASKGCGKGMTDNEDEAAKVFCPGKLKEPSQVDKSNTICLQPTSGWEFASYKLDKMCAQIPTDCGERKDPSISYGISAWGKVLPNAPPAKGTCDLETGIEPLKVYQWTPSSQLIRSQFKCDPSDTNCDTTYAEYARQFGRAIQTLESRQALANALNRNLNDDDINKIRGSLGNFANYHVLTISPIVAPARSCKLNKQLNKEVGLVENPCMIQNSCAEIKKPAYITGFATWAKIDDNDLKTADRDKSQRQLLAEILLTAKGKCPAGYKEGKAAPTRECSLKYVNTKLVGGSWGPVSNPCVPAPAEPAKKKEPQPKT